MRRRASRASLAAAAAVLIGGLAVLTGCVPESAAPSSSPTATSEASPTVSVSSATPSPTPSPTEASASVSIPASCDDLGTASTREETVGGLTAQHSDGFVRPAPANAATVLSCNWIQEESSGVLLLISTASASDVTAGLAGLAGQGYTCQAAMDFGAQYCVKDGGTVETEDVVVARDGVWIYLETVNVNARAWLSEIASQIFG